MDREVVRIALVPLMMLLVAAAQLCAVSEWRLSRWRGGGFGMYSEIHPNHTQIEVETGAGASVAIPHQTATCPGLQADVHRCQRLPTTACLCGLMDCLPDDARASAIVAFRPTFDPTAGRLGRARLAECRR